jgi:type II secretory pathway pseudopilin PulG
MNKDKKVIVVLIIIIIVLVVGFLAFSMGKNSKEKASDQASGLESDEKNLPQVNNIAQENKSSCDTGYEKTAESKIVQEESPTLITGFVKKCDGNYYFTLDYLSIGGNNINSGGILYTNTNTKLREFKADSNLKVKIVDNRLIPLTEYINSLRQMEELTYNQSTVFYGLSGQPVFYIAIKNGVLVGMDEVYQP